MSPTKQAKSQGNSGKEPNLHQRQNGEKNPGRTQTQSGASSPLANEGTVITKQIECFVITCALDVDEMSKASEYDALTLIRGLILALNITIQVLECENNKLDFGYFHIFSVYV